MNADQIFALDQLLAVLERRLNYEAFDYDAAVPVLSSAIAHFEEGLEEVERSTLASIRSQHPFYRKKPKGISRGALLWSYCPLCGVECPRSGNHKKGCPAKDEGSKP